jgi:zinc protease
MRPLPLSLALLAAFALSACAATMAGEETAPAAAAAPAAPGPAPVAELVRRVDIPYERFTLDNGLEVVVHEDRKAPVVAVSVWYNVGSKDEPPGRTGFAHLFEHLMFGGSENVANFDELVLAMGASNSNGTTWFDRTNYFQTVPTGGLEQMLFIEADRMGRLLGAVTQEKLDAQRGVVQNEKRQGDNEPYGLVEYAQLDALFPEGHPYRHSTIGSMADLDSASLADVKQWFRERYGPNNAVLVLAGDVDAAAARPLVEKHFGDIPRGPVNTPAAAGVPTLAAPRSETMKDRVAQTRLYRNWVVPGLLDEDSVALDIAAAVLGGLSSSRLDNALVRKEQTAVRVSADVQRFHRISLFEVQVDVKEGADVEAVARRLDEIVADLIANGPTADEVQRVATTEVAGRIRGLEQVGGFGGKAVVLAEGALYAGDPGHYRKEMAAYAAATPASVRAALRKWLTRPVYALRVDPGERGAYEEAKGATGGSAHRPSYYREPAPGEEPMAALPAAQRPVPSVGEIPDLDFPEVERATLSNGIGVTYARREGLPLTRVAVEFDAGIAADPAGRLGTQSLMLNLLTEGTTSLDSIAIAEAQERLGANIAAGASLDRTAVTLSALTPNLDPSLALLADIVRNPAFAPAEVERLRAQQLATIANEKTQPARLAQRALPPLLFGPGHPYGKPLTGSGDSEAIQAVTRDELIAFHQSWIRPDNARLFAVGDRPLDELLPMLEARFGGWAPPAAPKGVKAFTAAIPAPRPRIVLIDRPQSPQSYILAGMVLPFEGRDEHLALEAADQVLGNSFLSRINTDLRETKAWSYGSYGYLYPLEHRFPWLIQAPVQADKTGPAIAALVEQVGGFVGARGVTPVELSRIVNQNARELASNFETGGAVLGALRSNALFGRPDDYYETLSDRYRGMTATSLDAAARQAFDPNKLVWVVVGDAALVRPQLDKLGLPIEIMAPR